jgi:Tol biopolymer transport system component
VKKVILLIIVALLLLAGSAAAYIFWMAPRLVEVSPAEDAGDVRAGSAVRLTFSRKMLADSVLERLSFDPPLSGSYEWRDESLIFTPDKPWTSGANVRVRLDEGASADSFLPLNMRGDTEWSFQIGHPRLAYLYPAEGPANIYAYNLDTDESERLTDYLGGVLDFHVNSSGTAIYFSLQSGQGGSSIYRLDLLGEGDPEPVRVLDCPQASCRNAQMSPSGEFIAYERTAFTGSDDPPYPQVWLLPLPEGAAGMDRNVGLDISKAFRAADALNQTIAPHWSPGGLLTYYDFTQSAFVIQDPHGDEIILFPNQTGQPGSWHPSGAVYAAPEIFFVEVEESDGRTDLDSIGSSHIILFRSDGGDAEDLTQVDTLEDTAPVFSPDGSRIAFARKFLTIERWTPGRQLWIMDPESGQEQQMTNDPFYNHFNFAWSPADGQLAFVRFNQTVFTEPPEVWIIDLLTTQAALVVKGGFSPQWMP